MSENRIRLPFFVGINFIAYSLMLACFLAYINMNGNLRSTDQKLIFWGFMLSAVLSFFAGFGLCLSRNWARILTNVLLILSMIIVVIMSILVFNQIWAINNGGYYRGRIDYTPYFVLAGMIALFSGLLVGSLLFINNRRVVKVMD